MEGSVELALDFEVVYLATICMELEVGEILVCEREPSNVNDRYAVYYSIILFYCT